MGWQRSGQFRARAMPRRSGTGARISRRRQLAGGCPQQFDRKFHRLVALLSDVLRRRVPRRRHRCRAGHSGQGGVMKPGCWRARWRCSRAMAGAACAQGVPLNPQDTSGLARSAPKCCSGARRSATRISRIWRRSSPAMSSRPGEGPRAARGQAAADPRRRDRRLHRQPECLRPDRPAGRQDPPRTLRARLWAGRALDELLGRQVVHLDPGRRGDQGRVHQVGR